MRAMRSPRGRRAVQVCRWWTPACASSAPKVGCTTEPVSASSCESIGGLVMPSSAGGCLTATCPTTPATGNGWRALANDTRPYRRFSPAAASRALRSDRRIRRALHRLSGRFSVARLLRALHEMLRQVPKTLLTSWVPIRLLKARSMTAHLDQATAIRRESSFPTAPLQAG
jgi:hypothetical protein